LPEGYDTSVGERGSGLSGGQRQRIAIARALLTDPRILIFDEATSALDYESERVIQQNMADICRGRTVFVIAHRLSALRNADRIVTIEHGRIIEDGTHQALVVRGGRYAALYRIQSGLDDRKSSPQTIDAAADARHFARKTPPVRPVGRVSPASLLEPTA
jgi:subfamily B ATP-binding cassette protein HlyB/CyaB